MADFGDAEAAVVAILRADDTVNDYTPDGVATDLIGYTAPDRWLRIVRTGGIPTLWMRVDNPLIEVAAYAEDKGAALDLARAARRAIYAGRGYTGNGLLLYDVNEETGLAWSPDDEVDTTPRYTFTLALVTKPWEEP
jgi:hypothetical protein